jgi:hypothetical protein
MPIEIVFRKTGKETKTAIQNRRQQLEQRLAVRNQALDQFLQHPAKVRSYLIRQTERRGFHAGESGYVLYSADDVSSEEAQEITQLYRRIFEIEQELHRLALIAHHLKDNQEFELSYDDLIGYGFEASLEVE